MTSRGSGLEGRRGRRRVSLWYLEALVDTQLVQCV